MANKKDTVILLVDNGSIRSQAVLYTRKVARMLSSETGYAVLAASIAHSDRILPEKLNGISVPLVESLLEKLGSEESFEKIVVLPFMLVDQGAIFKRLRLIVDKANQRWTQKEFLLGNTLISETDGPEYVLSRLVADQVERVIDHVDSPEKATVVVVDHGSPYRKVAEVRNRVACEVGYLLEDKVKRVVPCSLERREGVEYEFNEPLLESALTELALGNDSTVILCRLFLLPGKHSGKGGDVEQICMKAEECFGNVKILPALRVFSQKKLISVLVRRLEELGISDAYLK